MSVTAKPSFFKTLVHSATGAGLNEEREKLLSFPIPINAVVAPTSSESRKKLHSATQTTLSSVIARHPLNSDRAIVASLRRLEEARRQYDEQLVEQIEKTGAFPAMRGMRIDENVRNKHEALKIHLQAMDDQWERLFRTANFCIEFPLLPDCGRIEYLSEFAIMMEREKIPGADDLRDVVGFIARKAQLYLPTGNELPTKNNTGKAATSMSNILASPVEAACKEFECFHIEPFDGDDFGEFKRLARQCENLRPPGTTGPAFEQKVQNLARKMVLGILSELSRKDHEYNQDQLSEFAKGVHEQARQITRQHKVDVVAVQKLDIGDEASVREGVAAMRRVQRRCPIEFERLGHEFRLKCLALVTERRLNGPNPFPEFPERVDADFIDSKMPAFREIKLEASLADFLQECREMLRRVDRRDMPHLARGDAAEPYLQALKGQGPYRKFAERLIEKIRYQDDDIDLKSNRPTWGSDPADSKSSVRNRLNDFESIRYGIEQDIRGMLYNTGFYASRQVEKTIALIYQMETGSPETGLHARNAFIFAWDHKPQHVQKLQLEPDYLYLRFVARARTPEEEKRMTHSHGLAPSL